MHRISRIVISSLGTAGLYLMSVGLGAGAGMPLGSEAGRMKNVIVLSPEPTAAVFYVPEHTPDVTAEAESGQLRALKLPAMDMGGTEAFPLPEESGETVLETTIDGGMRIKNETAYFVDAADILADGPRIRLPEGEPQILIIHTHASEAYTQAGLDRYKASDSSRTEDTQFNVVRIGDELTQILSDCGLNVIHDRGIYDYPSYTGSYTRSGQAVEQYLESYPGIKIVLDIHRDALGSDSVVYKTMAEEDGVCASQIMLLVGSDESGLEHPGWQDNLSLALYLQQRVVGVNPTLMRPVQLVRERYNQHLSPGSLILEVGSSGNTLQEALAAIRLFGKAAGPALYELVGEVEVTGNSEE